MNRPGISAVCRWPKSAEDAALDLATVVLESLVQVNGGRPGCRLRVAVPDRPVNRGVFRDRLLRMTTDCAVQPDGAGLALQAALLLPKTSSMLVGANAWVRPMLCAMA